MSYMLLATPLPSYDGLCAGHPLSNTLTPHLLGWKLCVVDPLFVANLPHDFEQVATLGVKRALLDRRRYNESRPLGDQAGRAIRENEEVSVLSPAMLPSIPQKEHLLQQQSLD